MGLLPSGRDSTGSTVYKRKVGTGRCVLGNQTDDATDQFEFYRSTPLVSPIFLSSRSRVRTQLSHRALARKKASTDLVTQQHLLIRSDLFSRTCSVDISHHIASLNKRSNT